MRSVTVAWATLLCLQGCTLLLDTGSLTNDSGSNATAGSGTAGSSAAGASSAGMGNAGTSALGSAGSASSSGAGGSSAACVAGAEEACDGMDNDCDASTSDDCPTNCRGIERDGSGYMACGKNSVDFETAEASCEEQGMRLVKIDDDAEDAFVASLVADLGAYVWIGARSEAGAGIFTWLDGTVMYDGGPVDGVYQHFAQGQPAMLSTKDCVQFEALGSAWSNTRCSDTQEFICEAY
jgi:hypothetical protein